MSERAPSPGTSRSIKALAALFTLVAALLLVALVTLVQRSGGQRDRALARTQHSYQVVLLTTQTQGAMARAEAALGRFVLDSDRRTGTIYYDEWQHAGRLLDDLATLTRDNPAQVARLDRLRGLYAARGRELAASATRATYHQGMAGLSLYYKAGRSPTLPEIGQTLQAVADAEDALLDQRAIAAAARLDHSDNLTRLLSVVGVMLALSVIALAWLVVSAMAQRRIAREEAELETDRADLLEHAVATRTAELSDANARLLAEAATRAEAEAQLRQMQKMEAVGQLTGGIAHDFNNMLAVVLGGLEMARLRPDEASRHIDSAFEGAERAAALTRRLLSFARAEPLLPAAVAPGKLLRGMSDLLDRTIGERIEVRIVADAELWPVWIDGYQLENAVLNLAVNARDAMDGAGTLEMRAANVRVIDGEIGALLAGDYVRIAVRDTGSGMTADVLERVFEPFFTTKPEGQGTGLGLSQIFGFARQSGGDVTIASAPGEGTTVSIYLPRHRAGAAARSVPAATGATPRGPDVDERILLVEDDPRVRAATETALDELGCTVLACASARDALDHLDAGVAVALLMTDVVMPEMNGIELVRAARARRPALPVLFVTGFVGEAGEAEGFRDGAVLRKPFTLRALAKAIAHALETSPAFAASS